MTDDQGEPPYMDNKTDVYAVLTGDVVGSSTLMPSDLKKVMMRLRVGAERFAETFPDPVSIYGKLDVFRGDGWQMVMPDWKRSLRAAVFIRAVVKADESLKVDTRVAVAWGSVDVESLNPERVSESTGGAFTRSGRTLAEMRRFERMVLAAGNVIARDKGKLLSASLLLLDELVSRWKPGQAQAIGEALLGRDQDQIARLLKIKQPTVSNSLNSAGWKAIGSFLAEVEV